MAWSAFLGRVKPCCDFIATLSTILGVVYGIWKTQWETSLHKSTRHLGLIALDEHKMGCFVAEVPAKRSWDWWFPFCMKRVKVPIAPSVAGLIRAGDESIFSSSMFDDALNALKGDQHQVFDDPDDANFQRLADVRDASVSWRPILEAFLKECAWKAEQNRGKGIFGSQSSDERLRRYQDFAEFEIWRTKKAAEGKEDAKWKDFQQAKSNESYSLVIAPLKDKIPVIDQHLLYYPWRLHLENANGTVRQTGQQQTDLEHHGASPLSASGICKPILVSSLRSLEDQARTDDVERTTPNDHDALKPTSTVNSASYSRTSRAANSPRLMADARKSQAWIDSVEFSPLWIYQGSPTVKIFKEELAALCFTLGIDLEPQSKPFLPCGTGGYSILLLSNSCRGMSVMRTAYGNFSARDRPSAGSGYSTLFAKHMACGSIPFAPSDSQKHIMETIYVSDRIAQLIKGGKPICDWDPFPPARSTANNNLTLDPELRLLLRMPSSRHILNYYDDEAPSSLLEKRQSKPAVEPKGLFWTFRAGKEKGSEVPRRVGSWAKTVAGIAFGGLVPVASERIVDLVAFTVGLEAPQGADFEAIYGLIKYLTEVIHKQTHKDLYLFGPWQKDMAEIEAADKYRDYAYEMTECPYRTTREIINRLKMFTTLLEACIARVQVPKDDPKFEWLEKNSCNENAFKAGRLRKERVFQACVHIVQKNYEASCIRKHEDGPKQTIAALINDLISQKGQAASPTVVPHPEPEVVYGTLASLSNSKPVFQVDPPNFDEVSQAVKPQQSTLGTGQTPMQPDRSPAVPEALVSQPSMQWHSSAPPLEANPTPTKTLTLTPEECGKIATCLIMAWTSTVKKADVNLKKERKVPSTFGFPRLDQLPDVAAWE